MSTITELQKNAQEQAYTSFGTHLDDYSLAHTIPNMSSSASSSGVFSSDAENGRAGPLSPSFGATAGTSPAPSAPVITLSYAELLAQGEQTMVADSEENDSAANAYEQIDVHGRIYNRWWVQNWRRAAAENPAAITENDPVPRDATGQTDPVLLDEIRVPKAELQRRFKFKAEEDAFFARLALGAQEGVSLREFMDAKVL